MLKIRRPFGRLIFNMGIAIPGKTVFLIETAPRSGYPCHWPFFREIDWSLTNACQKCYISCWRPQTVAKIELNWIGEALRRHEASEILLQLDPNIWSCKWLGNTIMSKYGCIFNWLQCDLPQQKRDKYNSMHHSKMWRHFVIKRPFFKCLGNMIIFFARYEL